METRANFLHSTLRISIDCLHFSHLCRSATQQFSMLCMISGFCHKVTKNLTLLGYYTASSGNSLLMFRDYLRTIFRFQESLLDSWTLRMGPIGCPEILVTNYHYSLRNNPEHWGSQFSAFPLKAIKHVLQDTAQGLVTQLMDLLHKQLHYFQADNRIAAKHKSLMETEHWY
jgi:hypothetical protein